MTITIQKLEKGGQFNKEENGQQTILQQWRITDQHNRVYLSWIPDDKIIPEQGKTYDVKETGETNAYFNGDKGTSQYNKITIIEEVETMVDTPSRVVTGSISNPVSSIPQTKESPSEVTKIIPVNSDSDYHKMAMTYLSSIGKLNLINLNELAPHFKSICEGRISDNQLGILNIKYYGDA